MRKAGGPPSLKGWAYTNTGWVERLYLGRTEIRDATCVVGIAEVAVAQAIQGYCPLSQQGADDAGVVEVEEEEEFVTQDRSADIAAELILDQVIAGNYRIRIVAEPAVGHQGRIAMVFVDVAVKLIGAGLGDKLKLAAAGGAAGCLKSANGAVELFDGIDGRVAHDGKSGADAGPTIALCRAAGGEVIDVQAIDRDVVLVNAGAGYGSGVSDAGLQREERHRVVPLLHGKAV